MSELLAPTEFKHGGEGGIRTPDTLSGMPVFKTGAINHSATSPVLRVLRTRRAIRSLWLVYNTSDSISLPGHAECPGMKLHDLGKVREKIRQTVVAGIRMIFVPHIFLL